MSSHASPGLQRRPEAVFLDLSWSESLQVIPTVRAGSNGDQPAPLFSFSVFLPSLQSFVPPGGGLGAPLAVFGLWLLFFSTPQPLKAEAAGGCPAALRGLPETHRPATSQPRRMESRPPPLMTPITSSGDFACTSPVHHPSAFIHAVTQPHFNQTQQNTSIPLTLVTEASLWLRRLSPGPSIFLSALGWEAPGLLFSGSVWLTMGDQHVQHPLTLQGWIFI